MNRLAWTWVVGAVACIAVNAAAQEQLPKKLEGTWTGSFSRGPITSNIGGELSVVIEKQSPDGAIEGKMTFSGNQYCELQDDPITGKFDGAVLTLYFTFRNKIQNGGCGKSRFVMNRDSDGTFAGEIPNHPSHIRAKLVPR
jgi:hypothetical protein